MSGVLTRVSNDTIYKQNAKCLHFPCREIDFIQYIIIILKFYIMVAINTTRIIYSGLLSSNITRIVNKEMHTGFFDRIVKVYSLSIPIYLKSNNTLPDTTFQNIHKNKSMLHTPE